MIQKILAILMVFLLLPLTSCDLNVSGRAVAETSAGFFTADIPMNVAKLEPLNLDTVERFEDYKSLIDHMNTLIDILNENDLFDIYVFPEPTVENWGKISKTLTKWGPLIENYNKVVVTSKTYNDSQSEENLNEFYIAAGKFSLEAGLVVWSAFYGLAFKSVGVVYRAVGLNKYAVSCPSCISTILSSAHWFIRGVLVNGSSEVAEWVIRGIAIFQGVEFDENN